MRRTNEDKRRAVLALLNDAEWQQWSDREIARACAVHQSTVGTLRISLSKLDSDIPTERTYTDRWGNTSVMDTSGLRRPAPEQPPEPELEQPLEQQRQQHSDAAERRSQAGPNGWSSNSSASSRPMQRAVKRQKNSHARRTAAGLRRQVRYQLITHLTIAPDTP
ncbi:MAG: hypothetical protein ACKOC5_19435 [Chloroflexota bacterium]